MNRLCLLRHAKAVPQGEAPDRERALADRGERDIRRIAAWIARQKPAPDLVLCSSAARTRQTADAVLSELRGRPVVHYEDGLYLAEAADLLARLRRVAPAHGSVLLVGHNPGLHELAILLAGGERSPPERRLAESLPTGAVALFDVPVDWSDLGRGKARLLHFVTPKDLARERT